MVLPTTPGWLLKPEGFVPPAGRNPFIQRSIESVLGALVGLASRGRPPRSRLGFSALVKGLTAVAAILLVSLSHTTAFLLIAGTAFIAVVSMQRVELILSVLKVGAAAAAFALLTIAPSLVWGNPVRREAGIDGRGMVKAPPGPGVGLPAGPEYPAALEEFVVHL